MAHMWEVHEARDRVHADPFRGLLADPRALHLADLGRFGGAGGGIHGGARGAAKRPLPAPDELMAPEAGLHRGNAGLTRDRDRRMTEEARHPVLPGVDVVPEEDRLAGTIQVSRVADDGSVLG